MLIESMAGKSGSLHGLTHDATSFVYSDEEPAADYFGSLLTKGMSSLSLPLPLSFTLLSSCYVQLVTIIMGVRGCIVVSMAGNLKLTYSLVLFTIKD